MFGAYPVVLLTLPGGIHWVRLLFFTLFLLGIDSAFALTDAVITVTADSVPGAKLSRKLIVSGWCILGFLTGLLYATDAGFVFLDVFDFYINFLIVSYIVSGQIWFSYRIQVSLTPPHILMWIFAYYRLLWDFLSVLQ